MIREHARLHPLARRRVIAFLTCAALVACGRAEDPAGPVTVVVAVQAAERTLTVRNPGREPLAVFVVERQTAALINWAPCASTGPGCLRLAPGGSITVAYTEVTGWTPQATEAIVYTWRVLPKHGGGYRAGPLGSYVVDL